MDIKEAYRMVPVHPEDRHLLAVRWKGVTYVDKVLPFGLRSSAIIFSAVADALQWLMERRGARHIFHYVDDFIAVGRPQSAECADTLVIMKATCSESGAPIEEEKCEGPAITLPFLGMELDTVKLEIRLPSDKLERLKSLTAEWRGRKAGIKRELRSLIGILNHACKAVRQGRTFLRRLIDLTKAVKHPNHFIRLNTAARSDIMWWYEFANTWNGVSMLSDRRTSPDTFVTSDASGRWGCGAYCEADWFQLQWGPESVHLHITIKELILIVIAATIWGKRWSKKTIIAQCDNAAVVAIINSGTSKDCEAMHLMRCLAFISAKYEFSLFATHISGVSNVLADALSRNNAQYFLSNYPQAHTTACTIPQELYELLIVTKPD